MKTPANLFIMCGLPGSGKTTVARKIAGRVNGVLFTADVVRREMFDVRTYSEEERQAVYEELLRRSAPLLAKGISVVLDATYMVETHRTEACRFAARFDVDCKLVHVVCHEDVAKWRISQRINDASEADVSVYLKLKDSFEPIHGPHTVIDNSKDWFHLEKQLKRHFKPPLPLHLSAAAD